MSTFPVLTGSTSTFANNSFTILGPNAARGRYVGSSNMQIIIRKARKRLFTNSAKNLLRGFKGGDKSTPINIAPLMGYGGLAMVPGDHNTGKYKFTPRTLITDDERRNQVASMTDFLGESLMRS